MKLKTIFSILVLAVLTFVSCRTEETEFIQAPEDETLTANSSIALLMQRTSANDGSIDNIVDKANCLDISFPYSINANGSQITVNSEDDFALIECVFDQSDSDTDSLTINYPITIVLADFSEIIINSLSELNSYTNNCNGENVEDDDIECLDFQYPIITSVFNSNNELLDVISLESDNQLYEFVKNIDENDIVTMDFPITVILSDNSESNINNFNELEIAITNVINTCEEDDNYDFSDDDCIDCTTNEIADLLVNCADWEVNRLKRQAIDYDTAYNGYAFNFFADGTLSVFWNTTTVMGNWTASGSGNNLEVLINVPSLPLCNNNWILQEIKNCSEATEINLTVGNDDRLQYKNNCY